MMRYSPSPKLEITRLPPEAKNAEVAELDAKPDARRAAIVLVGARDPRSLAIRMAQAHLRFDQRPSYWSHAALLLSWEGDAADARGVEVTLDPEDDAQQVPERNGVTSFRLARYLDDARYPNFCVATFDIPAQNGEAIKQHILDAALHPNRERSRYPLWDLLAPWARYTYAPLSTRNPLLEPVALPSAALCEYAYEAGGLDIIPGATAPNACPELLWSTLLYWHDRIRELGGTLHARCVLRDEIGAPLPTLSSHLRAEFQ